MADPITALSMGAFGLPSPVLFTLRPLEMTRPNTLKHALLVPRCDLNADANSGVEISPPDTGQANDTRVGVSEVGLVQPDKHPIWDKRL